MSDLYLEEVHLDRENMHENVLNHVELQTESAANAQNIFMTF